MKILRAKAFASDDPPPIVARFELLAGIHCRRRGERICLVTGTLRGGHGQLCMGSISISPSDGEIDAELLRGFSPYLTRRAVVTALSARDRRVMSRRLWEISVAEARGSQPLVEARRPVLVGRWRARRDDYLAQIAHWYIDIVTGGERRVLVVLSERLGMPVTAARDLVHECRVRGFLAPTRPGKADATPGPRLLAPTP